MTEQRNLIAVTGCSPIEADVFVKSCDDNERKLLGDVKTVQDAIDARGLRLSSAGKPSSTSPAQAESEPASAVEANE